MGWLQLGRSSERDTLARTRPDATPAPASSKRSATSSEHAEYAAAHDILRDSLPTPVRQAIPTSATPNKIAEYRCYPHQPPHLSDDQLPFISAEAVSSKRKPGLVASQDDEVDTSDLWIVVDDIVYDCSEFVSVHPGGRQVILSFAGEDCSWQFWRFHSRSLMQEYGRPLRIGRTSGITNRFQERPRYVGLSRLGRDDC